MNENIGLFLKKAAGDAELLEKLKTTTDPDEAYALAAATQGGFTKEEFNDAMTMFKEMYESDEVSDKDLANVAGGVDWEDFVLGVDVAVIGTASAWGVVYAIAVAS